VQALSDDPVSFLLGAHKGWIRELEKESFDGLTVDKEDE
jgi:hypothetical protein